VDGIMRAGAGISFIRDEENVINDNELMKIEIPEPAE
jgi:hypothetical protein